MGTTEPEGSASVDIDDKSRFETTFTAGPWWIYPRYERYPRGHTTRWDAWNFHLRLASIAWAREVWPGWIYPI